MNKDIAADGVHPTQKGFELMKALALPICLWNRENEGGKLSWKRTQSTRFKTDLRT